MLRFILLIVQGNSVRRRPLWSDDFQKVLVSLKGAETADLRLKLVTAIALPNQDQYMADEVECPDRLLSVLETLNCNNISISMRMRDDNSKQVLTMEEMLKALQLAMAFNRDPKIFDGLVQKNCSQMPRKFQNACQVYLTGKLTLINIPILKSGLNKCYQGHYLATNNTLSHR